jgi:hypothetical protein
MEGEDIQGGFRRSATVIKVLDSGVVCAATTFTKTMLPVNCLIIPIKIILK